MMNLTSNSNGNGNGKSYLKVGLLVVAIALVGFLLFRQVSRSYGPVRTVWVATSDLASGTMISGEHIKAKKTREKSMPQGALTDSQAILGRQIDREKLKGDTFQAGDFTIRRASAKPITDLVPDGRVMMTVSLGTRAAPVTSLVQGDRMDILVAGGAGKIVARDAYMIGTIGTKRNGQGTRNNNKIFGIDLTPPTLTRVDSGALAVLLGINPEDVFPLARAQASGAKLSIILHGRAELADASKKVEIENPQLSRPAAVDLIAGNRRQQVIVKR